MREPIVKHVITWKELEQLQDAYENAVEKNLEWIIQAIDIVFDRIDQGKIKIKSA
tara:strand:+ start:13772 stop:13936 length:165 start_codon:yes stop_codon:yes gene_type:complete